jgi:hypothetical protein
VEEERQQGGRLAVSTSAAAMAGQNTQAGKKKIEWRGGSSFVCHEKVKSERGGGAVYDRGER